MNKFSEMHFFVTVVDAGSMSEAARRLGTTKSMVSERVQQLEKRLGTSLMTRGRQMLVTEPGQTFYNHSVRILADVGEAEDAVIGGVAGMRGHLRLAAPLVFSVRYIAPVLPIFARNYPDLRLDIESDRRDDSLNEENYDVAIRLGTLQDSNLVARPIAVNRHVICASPAYLEQRGMPEVPEDLHDHDGLLCVDRAAQNTWQLPVNGELQWFRIRARMRTDSGHQLLEGAIAGLGLAILPTFLATDAIASNALQIVLPAYAPNGGSISAIYRKSHRASPKIHALVNFLAEQIGRPPVWEQAIQGQLNAFKAAAAA